MIIDKGIGRSISEIIRRDDYLLLVGQEVNCILTNMLPEQIKLECNDSIRTHHLNGVTLKWKQGGEGRGEQRCGLCRKALMWDLGTRLECRHRGFVRTGKTLWK